jgi:phage shock protein PspC (stress-responsive transcriptional regulator)
MRKVTTINLNGRAYQLEEEGYEALQKYLHKAEAALAHDPDKAEVLADLEQAIADKCERLLKNGKNVVTAEQVAALLEQMGAVEGSDTEPTTDKAGPKAEKTQKRLSTIRDGALILGVCKGIAAYLGVEPNIIRVLFVIFVFITHGFGIFLYIALGLFLPHARTDSELAAAYGEPVNAQDIVDRARLRATDPETIQTLSNGVVKVFRIAMKIAAGIMGVIFGILSFAYAWVLWQLAVGRLELHGSLAHLNGWREALAITLAYLIVALPVFLLFRVFDRGGEERRPNRSKWASVGEVTVVIAWCLALMGAITFTSTYAPALREYVHAHHGYLDIGPGNVCIDQTRCDLRPGGQPIHLYRY